MVGDVNGGVPDEACKPESSDMRMTLGRARVGLVVIGLVLPYAARLPRGVDWLRQYTDAGLGGCLFLSGFNAIALAALLAVSFCYRRPVSLLAPCIMGLGFLAWAHASLDLRADAQSAIALAFIPLYALVPIALGGVAGYAVDRRLRRYARD